MLVSTPAACDQLRFSRKNFLLPLHCFGISSRTGLRAERFRLTQAAAGRS
jgi:hypothetical protein